MNMPNKYKIAFIFSLVPYAAFLLMLIIVAFLGYGMNLGKHSYGLLAMIIWIGDLWRYWFDSLIIRHLIVITSVLYQIIYFLGLGKLSHTTTSKKEDFISESKKYTKVSKPTWRIRKIILLLSFLPYVSLLFISVLNMIIGTPAWGLFRSGPNIYGLDAFLQTIVLGALILMIFPLIPLCLIYQISYLIVKKIKNHKLKSETLKTVSVSDDNIAENKIETFDNFYKIKKVILILALIAWLFICLSLFGLFTLHIDDPYYKYIQQ